MNNEKFNMYNADPGFVPPPSDRFAPTESNRSRTVALLLSLFLGSFGIHNFYLGYTKRGILQLVFCLSCVLAGVSAIMNLIDLFKLISNDLPDADGKKLSK